MLLMSYGADLSARDEAGQLPIDLADTEEIKQAIRDEPRRRKDHGHKQVTEAPSAVGQSNNRSRGGLAGDHYPLVLILVLYLVLDVVIY